MTKIKNGMMQHLVNSMPGMVFWKSTELRYLGANKRFLQFLNLEHLEQLLGKTDKDLNCSAQERDYFSKSDWQVIQTKESRHAIQERLQRPDGSVVSLTTDKHPLYDDNQHLIGILCLSSFETNNQSAVQTYLENIIASVPYYIFWKDTNLVYLGCNQKFSGLVNKTPQEIIGKTDFELGWKEGEAELFAQGDKEVMSGQPKVNVEETLLKPDGSKTIMLVSKVPVFDKNSACIGVLGVSVDITERIKMEHDLILAKDAAESSSRAKAEFIANMSHDIRTPLSGIVGMSKLLEDSALSDEEKQYARWVNESGNQLLELLNGVLDVISADNIQESDLHQECFDLYTTIENIGRLELPAMRAKNIEFKVMIDKQVPRYVISDKTKFHRILLNLLGNAIKFTETGYVRIQIKFLGHKNGEVQLETSVEDTGIGIPEAAQASLFDRFYRANPSYKGIYRGHGLGLHIAQKYVALLKGEIKLTSQVGKGTRFYFTLSLREGTRKAAKQAEASECSRLPAPCPPTTSLKSEKPHLLLVEDNIIALRLLETLCTQNNCQFTSATNGEQALESAKAMPFDLIVSDIGLPGITGIELARRIREEEKHHNKPAVPIVGLTAHALEEATRPGLQAGMNKVIQKPIRFDTMQSLIKQYVYSTSQPDEQLSVKPATGLGLDLPETEQQLFELEDYPLLDIEQGINSMGNIETLKDLLKDMLALLPIDEMELEKAYSAKNWGLVEKTAHKIKGGAVYCGTVKMKYACQYLERYHRAGYSELLEKLYHQLIQIINETRRSIADWLK
ncbi:PAS domain-containing protein [Legionella sp. CNM-4043-24]|uniref:PAS domain-containing protein n=1 Tax=Legionella sp. CNM-4043-24 TaxID=3421646 RepID=UPI00403A8F21